MKRLVIIITLIVVLTSCKKEGIDYVRGTVVEDGTSIPVPGTKIYLSKLPAFHDPDDIIDSAITDEAGQYKLKYNKIIFGSYYVNCINADYSYANPSWIKLKHGKTAVNFNLIPHAYIKFRFIKTASSPDVINGRVNYAGRDISYFFPKLPSAALMQPFDTIQGMSTVYAYKNLSLEWTVLNTGVGGGVLYTKSDNVFINKGDTLLYTITFN